MEYCLMEIQKDRAKKSSDFGAGIARKEEPIHAMVDYPLPIKEKEYWRRQINLEEAYVLHALVNVRDKNAVENLSKNLDNLYLLSKIVETKIIQTDKEGLNNFLEYLRMREGLQLTSGNTEILIPPIEFARLSAAVSAAAGEVASFAQEKALLGLTLRSIDPMIRLILADQKETPQQLELGVNLMESYERSSSQMQRILHSNYGSEVIETGDKEFLFELVYGAKEKLFLQQLIRLPKESVMGDELIRHMYYTNIEIERGGRVMLSDIEKLAALIIKGENIDPSKFDPFRGRYIKEVNFKGVFSLGSLSKHSKEVLIANLTSQMELYIADQGTADPEVRLEAKRTAYQMDKMLKILNGKRVEINESDLARMFHLIEAIQSSLMQLSSEQIAGEEKVNTFRLGSKQVETTNDAYGMLLTLAYSQFRAEILCELGKLMKDEREQIRYIELLNAFIESSKESLATPIYESGIKEKIANYSRALEKLLLKVKDAIPDEFSADELVDLAIGFYERKVHLAENLNKYRNETDFPDFEELDRLYAMALFRLNSE